MTVENNFYYAAELTSLCPQKRDNYIHAPMYGKQFTMYKYFWLGMGHISLPSLVK